MNQRALLTVVAIASASLPFLAAVPARADLFDPTPYAYKKPPRPGIEGGTYQATLYFNAGPNCNGIAMGSAKFLPNGQGTGGVMCSKLNVEVEQSCPLKAQIDGEVSVAGGTYRLNGDGSMCEDAVLIGGPLDGTAMTFHTYIEPKGKMLLAGNMDIAYACPGLELPANGLVIANAVAFKVSKFGDDPPRSGQLPCTNP